MKFSFARRKPETRQESSYTSTLLALLAARVEGDSVATVAATAALEACSGLVQRAFMGAMVEAGDGLDAALDPVTLGMIGRSLIRSGEIVFLVEADMGTGLMLTPCQSWDVQGTDTDWRYRLDIVGPSEQRTVNHVAASSVLHFRYAVDPDTPWRGYGPLQVARLAGRLSAETVAALADESSGPRGQFLPQPKPGDDPTLAELKAAISGLKGRVALVESMGQGWDAGNARMGNDWKPNRMGAAPPDALVSLMMNASREVYAACGLSPNIFDVQGDGTSMREGWRQALFGVIAPLGGMVQDELRRKLDAPGLTLSWDELRASDLQGRARAFQSMVGAGMEVQRAAALSGLMDPE